MPRVTYTSPVGAGMERRSIAPTTTSTLRILKGELSSPAAIARLLTPSSSHRSCTRFSGTLLSLTTRLCGPKTAPSRLSIPWVMGELHHRLWTAFVVLFAYLMLARGTDSTVTTSLAGKETVSRRLWTPGAILIDARHSSTKPPQWLCNALSLRSLVRQSTDVSQDIRILVTSGPD
jgi:hypothetical protein